MDAPWGPLQPHRRLLATIYGGAAVLLVPWIVVLAVTQQPAGVAHHVRGLTFVALLSIAAALGVAVAAPSTKVATIAVTAAIAGALVATWFHVVSVSPSAERPRIALSAFVLAVVVVSGARALGALVESPLDERIDRPWRWPLLAAAVVVLVVAARVLAVAPVVAPVSHLRLAWVGLDVMELVALAATSWALRRGSAAAIVAGTVTGTLLGYDALVNVVASTGMARAAALVMCLAELPLAVGGFLIAWWAPQRSSGRYGPPVRTGSGQ